MTVLTLYFREGCHLCDDMALALRQLIDTDRHRIEFVDIDRDDRLRARYNADVPLLCIGDEVICRHFLDRERLAEMQLF